MYLICHVCSASGRNLFNFLVRVLVLFPFYFSEVQFNVMHILSCPVSTSGLVFLLLMAVLDQF